MFILYCISSDLDFKPENHTSIYENSELNIFKKISFLGETPKNWPNNLLKTNVYKTH